MEKTSDIEALFDEISNAGWLLALIQCDDKHWKCMLWTRYTPGGAPAQTTGYSSPMPTIKEALQDRIEAMRRLEKFAEAQAVPERSAEDLLS